MMKLITHLTLLALVFLACEEQGVKGKDSRADHDSASTAPLEPIDDSGLNAAATRHLPGVWAMTEGHKESFRLTKDSLYYPNNSDAYLYKATPDSIHFYMDGTVNNFGWKMRGDDTLEMIVDSAKSYFYYRIR